MFRRLALYRASLDCLLLWLHSSSCTASRMPPKLPDTKNKLQATAFKNISVVFYYDVVAAGLNVASISGVISLCLHVYR